MNGIEEIRNCIHVIRGKQVMFDKDLAKLYGVEVKNLNKAVNRNIERFPEDFMFRLTKEEYDFLRFQNGTIKSGRGEHSKYLPYVFTEQGVAMLSGVLRSSTAIQVNIRIMRAFVAVRQYLSSLPVGGVEIESRINKLEQLFDESLRDNNDINEDTRMRLEQIEQAIAEMRIDMRHLLGSGNPGRTIIKGFNKK